MTNYLVMQQYNIFYTNRLMKTICLYIKQFFSCPKLDINTLVSSSIQS